MAGSKLINYDSTALKMTLTIIVVVIGFIAFRFTKFGTYLKAIGAGEKAAMFSGIRTDRMKFLIYVLAGAITGFAAFINVIKVGSVTSSGGNQLETQILIALVLGGMPISGGAKVRFENIIVGSLLYIVLSSGLTMMGFTTQMMQLIQGVVFLIFVASSIRGSPVIAGNQHSRRGFGDITIGQQSCSRKRGNRKCQKKIGEQSLLKYEKL